MHTRREWLKKAAIGLPAMAITGDLAKLGAQDLEQSLLKIQLTGDVQKDEFLNEFKRSYFYDMRINGKEGTLNLKRRPQYLLMTDPATHTITLGTRIVDVATLAEELNRVRDRGLNMSNMSIAFPVQEGKPAGWDCMHSDIVSIVDTLRKNNAPHSQSFITNDKAEYARVIDISTPYKNVDIKAKLMVLSTGLLEKCQKEKSFVGLDRAIKNALNPGQTLIA